MAIPTDASWAFFLRHHDDIRSCCARFLPVAEMQIPNTRVAVVASDGSECVTDQRAARPLEVRHTLVDFDAAVRAKDTRQLNEIMNDAWLRAPEDRSVYRIPGFTEMCDLMDGTVDGFFQ